MFVSTRGARRGSRGWTLSLLWSASVVTVFASGCGTDVETGDRRGDLGIAPSEVFAEVKSELAKEGIAIERAVWKDPVTFRRYLDTYIEVGRRKAKAATGTTPLGGGLRTQDLTGGSPGLAEGESPGLAEGESPELTVENYCGPGSGELMPTVNECVNNACKEHDACYTNCTGSRGSKLCSFTSQTSPCDAPFYEAIKACPRDEQGGTTQLTTDAVIVLAEVIGSLPNDSLCGSDLSCGG